MCGIFGLIARKSAFEKSESIARDVESLLALSSSRGKDASGVAFLPEATQSNSQIAAIKSVLPGSGLIKTKDWKHWIQTQTGEIHDQPFVVLGHTRLATNGSESNPKNNQPVVRTEGVLVHNGIIVNEAELLGTLPHFKREGDLDSELLLGVLEDKLFQKGNSYSQAMDGLFSEIDGAASIGYLPSRGDSVVFATNYGSLYCGTIRSQEQLLAVVFASEKPILERFVQEADFVENATCEIHPVVPNAGVVVDFSLRAVTSLKSAPQVIVQDRHPVIETILRPNGNNLELLAPSGSLLQFNQKKYQASDLAFEGFRARAATLTRCTRCILPQTVPFIDFDSAGVCNFCRNYAPLNIKGPQALEKILSPYRKPGSERDCVVPISGGRDSCYGLHLIKNEFGMKPITYTYDWGMVTDLARRNISRMCQSLGVENVCISADLRMKRENIRKNVVAWLKKPHLGMVPLFMAGDKEFVWFSQRVKRDYKISLDLFTFNLLEKTQFKEEFTGIQMWEPGADSDQLGEKLRLMPRLKLASFYGLQFLKNPAYWNSSLLDTFRGYVAYYFLPQTFVPLFEYLPWNEGTVVDTLRNQFDWEVATDTQSTWRIGDGTSPFYNYIYYACAGFTENDTLRSNQVREGHLTRDIALKLAQQDNQPRYPSIEWYCDVVGLNFKETLGAIHRYAGQFQTKT